MLERTLLRKKTGRGIRELRLAGNPSSPDAGFRPRAAVGARPLTARAVGGKVSL